MDIEQLSQIIGDKWQIKIIYYCGSYDFGFNQLQSEMNVSRAVLTRKLNRLINLEILTKVEIGNRTLYTLTSKGVFFFKFFINLTSADPCKN